MHHTGKQPNALHKGEWNVDITYICMLQRKVMHGSLEHECTTDFTNSRVKDTCEKQFAKELTAEGAYLLDYLVQKKFLPTVATTTGLLALTSKQ